MQSSGVVVNTLVSQLKCPGFESWVELRQYGFVLSNPVTTDQVAENMYGT